MSATNYAMLYQRWEASVADCEALRAEVERLKKYEPRLVETHIREGEATARVKAPFAQDFALTMAALLTEHGAPNYIETVVTHDTVGTIAVTAQRCAGKTPHQFRQEAEAQRDAALASATLAREAGFREGVEAACASLPCEISDKCRCPSMASAPCESCAAYHRIMRSLTPPAPRETTPTTTKVTP